MRRRSHTLGLALTALVACTDAREPDPDDTGPAPKQASPADEAAEARARALERVAAYEDERRSEIDWATHPASDGRFGADPYALLALPETLGGPARVAALLRGRDRVALLDGEGHMLAVADAPHDPTGLELRGDELLVVGTGDPVLARFGVGPGALEDRGEVPIPAAFSPRELAVGEDGRVWIVDEGNGRLHELAGAGDSLRAVTSRAHCRGPIEIATLAGPRGELLVSNCLLEHRLRFDAAPKPKSSSEAPLEPLAEITHDGPIWAFDARDGLLALTGVEDRPLDRRDGSFGYIDSFVFIYALAAEPGGGLSLERRASVNSSALGAVTPKWIRWRPTPSGRPALSLAGYADGELLGLAWPDRRFAADELELGRAPWWPGTRAALRVEGSWLAADPLLDAFVVAADRGATGPATLVHVADARDDRSFDERLGEVLVFTTAMAPWNRSEGKRSRFTCETCHFEGRVDGRTHFTGREREGQPVVATSKPLLGLFPNRPHFSRALDRSTAVMVDNEFGVANRGSEAAGSPTGWFWLGLAERPWLVALPGWSEEAGADPQGRPALGPERLRRALIAFLIRWSMPQNPATRGREGFAELEARGAELFAQHCEGCHQARLAADREDTRITDPSAWEPLIFTANAPIVWASDAYVQTEIRPFVHERGARVPSLRRLHLDGPYFTTGEAESLAQLLADLRLDPEGGPAIHARPADDDPRPALDAEAREALAAFLRLL